MRQLNYVNFNNRQPPTAYFTKTDEDGAHSVSRTCTSEAVKETQEALTVAICAELSLDRVTGDRFLTDALDARDTINAIKAKLNEATT